MTTVLFACVHNAGRSQMAAAWFNLLADPAKTRAISAGTDPGTGVHPEVVSVMEEVGVDLSEAPTSTLPRDRHDQSARAGLTPQTALEQFPCTRAAMLNVSEHRRKRP
jgi:protein-tyrosine-phosphatase